MPRSTPAPALARILCAAAFALAAAPALADTFASSAIFNSVSMSVQSISGSFNASSNASSPGRAVRTGEYRIIQMAAAPDRPGTLRLTLRRLAAGPGETAAEVTAGAADVDLYLPAETVARAALATDQVIAARERPYGLEFAKGLPREAFLLVLADDWYRELRTQPVRL